MYNIEAGGSTGGGAGGSSRATGGTAGGSAGGSGGSSRGKRGSGSSSKSSSSGGRSSSSSGASSSSSSSGGGAGGSSSAASSSSSSSASSSGGSGSSISGAVAVKYAKDDLLETLKTQKEIRDVSERKSMLIKKLDLCCVLFDFTQTDSTIVHDSNYHKARDNKRQILMELVDYITHTKHWLHEDVMKHILNMLRCNLFRALPPPIYEDFDPEEDDPNFDPAWYVSVSV